MIKYYKADDVQEIFSDENRPLNWTNTEGELQTNGNKISRGISDIKNSVEE